MTTVSNEIYQVKAVPAGAWDTHFHIFETDKFSFAPGRHYTPSTATLEQCQQFHKSIGIENVCIAHGLTYGADLTSLRYYLEQLARGPGKARAICVLDIETTTDEFLDSCHAAGVRSVRLDLFRHGAMHNLERQMALIESTARRLVQWGKAGRWSIQLLQTHLEFWGRLREIAAELPFPLVIDHLALVPGQIMMQKEDSTQPTESEDFAALLGALRDGNVWIKISAPYRCSNLGPDYLDLEHPIRLLTKANPHRIIWGSDWPHTQRHTDRTEKGRLVPESYLKIDNKAWIRSLSRWLSEDEWTRMWVDNPRELYDYQ
jgi:predicted TIM-barrel fold metal-dependent hydrolase